MLVPSMGRVGGAESIIRGLTRGLEQRSWAVRWVVPEGTVEGEEAVPSYRYRGMGLVAGLRVAAGSRGLIHSHFAFAAWAHALLPGGPPRIRTFHGPWSEEGVAADAAGGAKTRLREGLELLSLARADLVLVLSRFSAAQLRRRGVPDAKVRIVPGFVDAERFTAAGARRPRSRTGTAPLLVANRRLTPRTGVNRLLEAVALLPPRYQTVRLEILGDGPQRADLQQQAVMLGLGERVRFRGRVSDRELSTSLSQADLAVIPTLALEGFGLSTIEALWHGTQVLVTPAGANPEIVRDLDPELVARGTDADALASAIVNLLDRRDDWDAVRAREYVRERFSLDRVVEQTLAVYEEATR